MSFFVSLKEIVYLMLSQNISDSLVNTLNENSVLLLSLVSSDTFFCMHAYFKDISLHLFE
jgi:hypothetical protein